jgi:translation initiation factor 2A
VAWLPNAESFIVITGI